MIYKINLEKKKEFEKWNLKQGLKHLLPIMIPVIFFMDFVMGFTFTNNGDYNFPISSIIKIIIISNFACFIFLHICFFIGTKFVSSKLETWELNIEENYAVLKNSMATTTVNFADFKKYKESNDSITFYFKGLRRFYINWNCFHDSEKLKTELKNIANKIGTFTKESVYVNPPKTKVKFNLVFYIFIGIICILNIVIKFLK